MGFWTLVLIAIIAGLAVLLAGWFVPWLIRKIRFGRIQKKEQLIDKNKQREIGVLESIQDILRKINAMPRYDTHKSAPEWLMEIRRLGSLLEIIDTREIKLKLLEYAERENQLHINIRVDQTLKILLGPDRRDALNLVKLIRAKIDDLRIIDKKKK